MLIPYQVIYAMDFKYDKYQNSGMLYNSNGIKYT